MKLPQGISTIKSLTCFKRPSAFKDHNFLTESGWVFQEGFHCISVMNISGNLTCQKTLKNYCQLQNLHSNIVAFSLDFKSKCIIKMAENLSYKDKLPPFLSFFKDHMIYKTTETKMTLSSH
jgi:hypothetical protein